MTFALFVVGGAGFLGLEICKAAVLSHKWKVYGLSRRAPEEIAPTEEWMKQVEWIQGDVNRPETYSHILNKVDAVVHTVGILFESGNQTFEGVNRDSTICLAEACKPNANIKHFGYISASHTPALPFMNPRYFSTKIEAEDALAKLHRFHVHIFRPGLIVSPARKATLVLDSFTGLWTKYMPLGATPSWMLVNTVNAPLLAKAICDAISSSTNTSEPSVSYYEVSDIQSAQ